VPKDSGLPPNVTEFKDRHGKWHLRFRQKGRPTRYLQHKPGTPEFRAELEACRRAPIDKSARIAERTAPGSIAALVLTYYGLPLFRDLRPSSQYTFRKMLERFVADWGHLKVKTLSRQAIAEIIGDMAETPAAANHLLNRLRVLMRVALDLGWRTDDPTYKLKGFKNRSQGFYTWSEADIEAYKARHPAGSKARRALYLLLFTSQRRGDVRLLGRQHVDDAGRINLRQQKTGAMLSIPAHPELTAELALAPKTDLTFLVTDEGQPYSEAGFGNWFRDQCDRAGLKQCSAHGLRKAAARRLAEAGCSHAQIKAITGHRTDKEVTRYIQAASQRNLADQALAAQQRSESKEQSALVLANRRKGSKKPLANL
jgi:integrase